MADQLAIAFDAEHSRGSDGIVLRDYQIIDHDESFRLWDSGVRGTLTRAGTGTGKTVMAIAKMATWLARGDDYRAMVISYEQELVHQFADEIEDFLGIRPGIEMADLKISPRNIPKIVVASRQSLLVSLPPSDELREGLAAYGIEDLGCAPHRVAITWFRALRAGHASVDEVKEAIAEINARPEANGTSFGRLFKFDWRYNWLLIFDEAHKHAAHLRSVGPIVKWFDRNPNSRRCGMTGTPKRSDGVSIGSVMFPGISLDYPLNKPGHPCAVGDGWAVPYVQRYIRVENVDFAGLKKVRGDFDENELEHVLGQEKQLASLIEPLLDIVGNRRTLIFSPGVQMAKEVARYINARSRAICTCGKIKWYPTLLIGDGAKCEQCERLIEPSDVDRGGNQAYEIDGNTPRAERKRIYLAHQTGEFQFLSVCGLCKEGYNDPGISCVAIFRPVSIAASSLAEQMKGRGCRPLRGLVNPHMTREERLEAIRNSEKPDCLIVDLVGVTGLADCASTVEIYAEGLPDEIVDRARKIITDKGLEGNIDVQEAIEQAKAEEASAREKIRLEREEAERQARRLAARRAKADARVEYTSAESGVAENYIDPHEITDGQRRMLSWLGLELMEVYISKKQAGRMISQLKAGHSVNQVALTNNLSMHEWRRSEPTKNQKWVLRKIGAPTDISPRMASMYIEASKNQDLFKTRMEMEIIRATSQEQLTAIAKDLQRVASLIKIRKPIWESLVAIGKTQRTRIGVAKSDF